MYLGESYIHLFPLSLQPTSEGWNFFVQLHMYLFMAYYCQDHHLVFLLAQHIFFIFLTRAPRFLGGRLASPLTVQMAQPWFSAPLPVAPGCGLGGPIHVSISLAIKIGDGIVMWPNLVQSEWIPGLLLSALFEKNSLSTKISSCKKSDVILELLGGAHYTEKKKNCALGILRAPGSNCTWKLLPKRLSVLRVYHWF